MSEPVGAALLAHMERIDRALLATLAVPPPRVGPQQDPLVEHVMRLLDLGHFGPRSRYGYPSATAEAVLTQMQRGASGTTDA